MADFPNLRLLQVTDLHFRGQMPGTSEIARRRSRHIPELLDRIEALLPQLQPDVIVVTGDLLHAPYGLFRGGNPFQMEDMTEKVRQDYAYLKDRFDGWRLPYVALPGNHDYEPVFASVFGEKRELEVASHRLIAFRDREWEGNVPWRRDEELGRFHDALRSEDARPQIHLQHYVVHPQVDHPYPHNYGDRDELLAALAGSPVVRLSLAGHFHDGSALIERDGTNYAIGPAICEPPHPVRLIELSADGEIGISDLPLRESWPSERLVVVSRDNLLAPSAHFGSSAGIAAAPELKELLPLVEGATVVCTSNLDRDDLVRLTWPELADAHDRIHQRLEEQGLSLDAIYYTTRHAPEQATALGLPRIALGDDVSVAQRAIADLRIAPSVVQTATIDAKSGRREWLLGDH